MPENNGNKEEACECVLCAYKDRIKIALTYLAMTIETKELLVNIDETELERHLNSFRKSASMQAIVGGKVAFDMILEIISELIGTVVAAERDMQSAVVNKKAAETINFLHMPTIGKA